MTRVDARDKVTGRARYTDDFSSADQLHGLFVVSSVARARAVRIDIGAAAKTAGLIRVFRPGDLGPFKRLGHWAAGQSHLPLSDARVHHHGQPIALVVATSIIAARDAASKLVIEYDREPFEVELEAHLDQAGEIKDWAPAKTKVGNVKQGLAQADAVVTQRYATADRHHAAMEPAAAIARWDGDRLELMTSTQWVYGVQGAVAEMLGLDAKLVRVRTPFVGGGFGAKGSCWPYEIFAALAARELGRAVRIVLPRSQTFTLHGHQPATHHEVTLGAQRNGTLTAVRHASWSAAARREDYIEHGSLGTRSMYACPNIETHDRIVRLDRPQPTFMRAPHEGPGMVPLEIAMDELAHELRLDPVALRVINHADRDPTSGKPFSSKALLECYRLGAERFGWSRRSAEPKSMRDGRAFIGWGMASALMSTFRFGAAAKVSVGRDGGAVVETAAHEIGSGAMTLLSEIAGRALGLPADRVIVRLGDTDLPEASGTFGSATTLSVGSAVEAAATKLRSRLEQLAGEPGLKPEEYSEVLALRRLEVVTEQGSWAPEGENVFAMNAYGAVFVEVRVDPDLPAPRVTRCIGAYSVGRVINPPGARAQIIGGLTWGIGQALLEESAVDPALGCFRASSLATYHVPACADVSQLEVIFADEFDSHASAIGARGVGEIGTIGVGAAVANAVFNATGVRFRRLPITLDQMAARS